MKNKNLIIYTAAVLCMVFWGLSFIWTSVVLEYYSPITTIFLRLTLSSALLFFFIKVTGKFEKIKKEDYKLFLLSALFNPFFYFIGENYGLKFSSPTITSVIIATIPLFTPIFGYFILKERLSKINIFGLLFSFFGVLVIIFNNNLSLNTDPKGLAFLFFAVASAVVYSILLKKLAFKYNPFTVIATQNAIGTLFFLPLFLTFDFHQFIQTSVDFRLISSLVSLAVFASSLAFVFFTFATRELGISKTGIFTNLIPAFTALFSFILLNEIFDSRKITGIAIVLGGVFLGQMKKPQKLVNAYRFIFRDRNNL
ncbi:MAG: DMT family transporter [Bacteroidales bacterium]|nr:DMT family transporter [Bacteroidales bacterium]